MRCVRLDRECFPDSPMPSDVLRRLIQRDRLLVAVAGGETVGIAIHALEPDRGYLTVLAVADAYRGRGIGASLTLRVAKSLFAEGAPRLDLKTTRTTAAPSGSTAASASGRMALAVTTTAPPTQGYRSHAKGCGGHAIRFGGWR